MREEILAHLREIEDLLNEAKCDGRLLLTCEDVYDECMGKLSGLEQAVEYYID
jgi:hypothetical protein